MTDLDTSAHQIAIRDTARDVLCIFLLIFEGGQVGRNGLANKSHGNVHEVKNKNMKHSRSRFHSLAHTHTATSDCLHRRRREILTNGRKSTNFKMNGLKYSIRLFSVDIYNGQSFEVFFIIFFPNLS